MTPHAPIRTTTTTAELYKSMKWSIDEVRQAIPARLFKRDTTRGLLCLARDLAMAATLWVLALRIDSSSSTLSRHIGPLCAEIIRWALWTTYWWFQGLVFTGIWVIGHECGHGAFSDFSWACDVIGYITHTLLWTPYFSWRISHHRHHMNHASMERDEVYVPWTRDELGIPDPKDIDGTIDYEEYFGDTPIYTLFKLVRQQLLAFPAYLLFNVSGQRTYPKWTNHYDPNAIIFTKTQRGVVIMSNLGILAMVLAVQHASRAYGFMEVVKYYGIPWLCVNHWFVMITYLHHTDPQLPHYRSGQWTFARGAAATMDRDFLGGMGDFFLHGVAHFHVVHHFFPKMPFYHGPEATKYLREFIGDHYNHSDKPAFKALWDNYNECQFVDSDGKHGSHGDAARIPVTDDAGTAK
ncbi:hypothetical protein PHLGIDRAFT_30042 [Phlebiopsis gigantea 11061_1 CR5-6]|uniref:Fatty acid desaturase domain-containing protein n=1 Tax=Phlebiopsis gigantea (strain 11061_1 CR5-6) TaxID=745531 RepID=A0A0C3RYW2_PHLG1|nr:hypothetical protein PHLGIDRAFT_30042 [Phlebiopsis gigantea 11061_1 CR5-6]